MRKHWCATPTFLDDSLGPSEELVVLTVTAILLLDPDLRWE